MSQLYLENFGPVHALPVLHYRMEFAHLVRQAVDALRPDCIALELPATLEAQFRRGVRRLPELSVLSYPGSDQTIYLIIEPADPLVEGARLALEREIPLHLVDADLDSYPAHDDPLPDSYAVQRIGLEPFYREVAGSYRNAPLPEEDQRRERTMAYRLQQLSAEYDRILFICGMSHLERIRALFDRPLAQPLIRTRREGITLANLHPECCQEILAEYPFLSALYETRRSPLPPEPEPARGASLRKSFHVFELVLGGKKEIPEEAALAEAVQRSARRLGPEGEMPDRQRVMLRLFLESARHYSQETGEKVHYWQKRAFFRFSRNYAFLSRALLPDLFQMLAAARGCLDDNFAYAFFRLASCYPWQRESSDLPTVRLSAGDLWSATRRIRFRPREQQRVKGRAFTSLKRKKEQRPGEWLEGFDNPSICSYPPEDLAIEQYGRNLKKVGVRQLSEEQGRCEPFTASLLDGIDMRETIRNLHEGKIYVRENRRVRGGIGCIVVIFDEDRGTANRYPYCMTWLGEHDQESDMAFYATPPTENIVGPGISRCEYGGFLLSYPPRRLYDVWQDPDYRGALGKAEVLLLAALDYSQESDVIYAAAHPPRSYLKQYAGRVGKRILYLPLGSLSPVTLKKLRIFHILYGRDKREIAKDYVW